MTDARVCPDEFQWVQLLDGGMTDAEQATLAEHLGTCAACQQRIERLAAGGLAWDVVARRIQGGQVRSAALPPPLAAAIQMLKERPTPEVDPKWSEVSPDLPPGFLAPPSEAGQLGRLGEYEVYEEVGRGAMGVVLRAFDPKLHRVVAIKVMSPHLASFPLARQRFVREGHSAAAVCHENVVAIYAVGEAAGLPYLVMQYVAGKTLQQRLDQNGPLNVAEILRIGMQAAAGLAAAHAQGLVHRDIKPANLLLENGVERVKLTDFGLARAVDDASITQTGVITGTPQFMAPEQARGEPIDARADLFSLGCVLYTLCTGRPPFRGSSTLAVLKRICESEPRPIRDLNPDIPDWLSGIATRLLAKQPDDRFASAKELSELLGQCLEHWQQPSGTPLPAAVAALTQVSLRAPSRAPTAPNAWWKTPRGILVLLVAMILPLSAALLNRWIDHRLGPNQGAREAPVLTEPRPSEPADARVLAELERLIVVAQKQWLMAKDLHERGAAPSGEVIAAEIALVQAKLRHARAAAQSAEVPALLEQLVALRQRQLEQAKARSEASVAAPSEILDAEKALSEARLELLQDAVQKDVSQIQGTWKVIALEASGKHAPEEVVSAMKFVFANQTLTVTPGEPGFTNFRFQLDPTTTPPRFDMTHADGTNKGETQKGIYLLAGGLLKICLGTANDRPTEFTAKTKSRQVMYILERERS